jgi:carbamoyltransferase
LWGIDRLNEARSTIPAVTHVDNSARLQTVDARRNPLYYRLLKAFERLTGCPVLVNTSFNVRGEPIVGSPLDAYRCFLATDMDVLAIGSFVLEKGSQSALSEREVQAHLARFELD